MKIRFIAAAGLAVVLSGCSSISTPSSNPVAARWVGQSAGKFFAAYGPPIADSDQGSVTVYTWRGGYKTVRIPVKKSAEDKAASSKTVAASRKVNLRCQAEITAGTDYVIRSIRVVGDMPGVNGPSYCTELLAPADVASQ